MFRFDRMLSFFLGDAAGKGNLNRWMKKKQRLIGGCVLVVVLIITLALYALSKPRGKHLVLTSPQRPAVVDGVLSTDFTKKDELSELEQQQGQLDRLKTELNALRHQHEVEKKNSGARHSALLNEINKLLEKREALQSTVPYKQVAVPVSNTRPLSVQSHHSSSPIHLPEMIQFHYATPVNHRHHSKTQGRTAMKTSRTYVPAGTFARGVLLEGADANASVNGQSDTVGILVRILENGTLPNGHHSHLKGCFVLASIYGDISSERGEARLTRVSCIRPDGHILDKNVQGYLSFAGKEGIKGMPVMRNGKILAMAGLSGIFSGIGSALQQSIQTQSVSPLGVTSTVSPNKIWENGAYSGVSTAMSQLAHYYIQRAEQYHPIIEIGSGTVATVIFQRGFSLVDDDTSRTDAPSRVSASMGHTEEIKALLKEAQHVANATSASPFSTVTNE